VFVDPVILLRPFVGEVLHGNVLVKTELIPRVTGQWSCSSHVAVIQS